MTIGKAVYGFDVGSFDPSGSFVLYFNKDLVDAILGEGTSEQLYDWQKNGEWTWEKFREFTGRIVAESKKAVGYTVSGITSEDLYIHEAFLASNGQSFVVKDADGKLTSALENPEFLAALDWIYGLHRDGIVLIDPAYDVNWGLKRQAFYDKKAVMYVSTLTEGWTIGNDLKDVNLGMLLVPKGPNVDNYSAYYEPSVYIFPNCDSVKEKLSDIAFAYDVYSDPVEGEETDRLKSYTDYFKDYFDRRVIEETIVCLVEKVTPYVGADSLLGTVYGDDIVSRTMTSLLGSRKDPQPIVAQYKDDFAAEIEQFNSKFAK